MVAVWRRILTLRLRMDLPHYLILQPKVCEGLLVLQSMFATGLISIHKTLSFTLMLYTTIIYLLQLVLNNCSRLLNLIFIKDVRDYWELPTDAKFIVLGPGCCLCPHTHKSHVYVHVLRSPITNTTQCNVLTYGYLLFCSNEIDVFKILPFYIMCQ